MKRTDAPGHINNSFVNADPQNNIPPSEVDASWLNHVQEEIANVIEHSGGVLNPASKTQLRDKIMALATDAVAGLSRIATQAEVNAGTGTNTVVTPSRMRMGFAASLTPNGYIALPTWMSGLIFQWGRTQNSSGTSGVSETLPIPFPTALYTILLTGDDTGSVGGVFRTHSGITNSTFSYSAWQGISTRVAGYAANYFCIGR